MSKFQELLNYFESNATTMRQKGSIFEKFVKKFLQIEPTYSNQFEKIWLWSEFPYRNGMNDTGIDIVAKCRNREEYCAIQCKFYSAETSVSKADVDTFLSASSTMFSTENSICYFTQRMIVSTTDKWSSNALSTIDNQIIPVNILRLSEFEAMAIDWEQFDINSLDGMKRSALKHILPHQKEALDAVVKGFESNDRGKLIMACGTGKTFTSLKIVEEMTKGKGNVIFFVPSISLLNQTLVEWSEQSSYPFNMLAICSDSNASKKSSDELIVDLVIPATTDSKKLVNWYNSFNKEQVTFIFSTYQSIDVVSKFQKDTGIIFDICVCDEAHRTTGYTLADEDESSFTKVHSNENINVIKRLYMTATPKVYGDDAKNKVAEANGELCSMDNEEIYGPELFKLGFGKAVELGLLSDYKVIVLTVSEEYVSKSLQKLFKDTNGELQLEDSVKIIGCWNGLSKITCYDEDKESFELDPEPMKTSVAFCNTIANSKAFKDKFDMIVTYYKTNNVFDKRVNVSIKHVDGKMNSMERKRELEWLKQSNDSGTCRILTNARCLSEGIDVPALDSVMFLSPRNSIIDIIQSVGRVMRRPYDGNKKYGYIILPIGIPAGEDPSTALNNNAKYKVVWDVLQALRAHDDRFNNTINKIDLNKKKPNNIQIIGVGYGDSKDSDSQTQDNKNKAYKKLSLDLDMEVLKDQVYAKIVKKCGSKVYWENWAKDVADIANRHITQIKVLLDNPENKKIFDDFVNSLRSILNPSITNEDAIEMLAEHLITKPVFDALFDNYSFVKSNSVSKTMQEMLDLLDKNSIEKDQKTLEKFYDSVRERAKGVDNSLGKQKIVIELYDKFFRVALKKQVEKLGIVYTPTEVVDFIIHSVEKLINKEFGKSLADKDVHILDPFTGTGTFIVRLIQSGVISKDDILYKYTSEIHANEIVLLAYYIAAVNIEEAFHEIYGKEEYVPFDNIVLTDTFELSESRYSANKGMKLDKEYFIKNSERARKQVEQKIQIIIGNPPYSIGQKSANDNAKNVSYDNLDGRISETYSVGSKASLQKGLYDSYIRAFRWASDRIDDNGIIGFVTNGSYIDNYGFNGFRKSLLEEFNSVYCFNLRGNQRTSGELSRKEGGKIFGSGSRTPIAITFLVKNKNRTMDNFVHYYDIGDYLSREEKLEKIRLFNDLSKIEWLNVKPDNNNDWINKTNPEYNNFIMLGTKDKDSKEKTIFNNRYAIGLNTGRDSWTINFSKENLKNNMNSFVNIFNNEIELNKSGNHEKIIDPTRISWTDNLNKKYEKNQRLIISDRYELIQYRPFTVMNLYYDSNVIERPGLWGNIYPTSDSENYCIVVTYRSNTKEFSCVVSNKICSLDLLVHCQCFPLYWYEEQSTYDIFSYDKEEYIRKYSIDDLIYKRFQEKYGQYITKEDIFYYIFGVLNSKKYQELYSDNLKKEMPRIPFLNHFESYVKTAKKLANIELNYEQTPHLNTVIVDKKSENYHVNQMKFAKDGKNVDKTTIIFNESIIIKNIPMEAYDYIVNGKSAIEWIMERYCVSQDKASGIVNDCNKYSDDPKYVLNLLLSVIAMSVKINEIIKELPEYEEI